MNKFLCDQNGLGSKKKTLAWTLPNFYLWSQIRFLKQLEHSAYIIATANANFDQEESFKEEV